MPKERDIATKQTRSGKPTAHLPVNALATARETSLFEWTLTLDGLVENPSVFPLEQFNALPQVTDLSDFPGVSPQSKYDCQWTGVAFTMICDLVQPKPEARFVSFTSVDGSSASVPLAHCLDDEVLVATQFAGEPIAHEHGGPIRIIIPTLSASKGTKAVKNITFFAEKPPGFHPEHDRHDWQEPAPRLRPRKE